MGPRSLSLVRSPLRLSDLGRPRRGRVGMAGLSEVRAVPVDRAAEAIWCGLIAAALGWDVWLLRGERRLLSDVARTRTGWAVQAFLIAHFAGRLGRFDPFVAASRIVPRRQP